MTLADIIKGKRLVVCAGSGGVGKTTTSAAIALQAAAEGLKTLVITIDPARRLAQSLGLEGLDNEERPVPRERLDAAGIPENGQLFAAMLDTKVSLDNLIARIARSPEQAQRILNNKIYRQFTNAIAGSQEYVAMERLHELMDERGYDLVVLDTPPTKNALDFLNAPNRLAAFLDEGVVKWFIRPADSGVRALLFKKGGEVAFKFLGMLVGEGFVKDLSEFFQAFNGLYGGFKERAEKVNRLLRDERTVFVLVTAAEHNALSEALFFSKALEQAGIPLKAVVVNRAYQIVDDAEHSPTELERILNADEIAREVGADVPLAEYAGRLAGKLSRLHTLGKQLNAVAAANIDRLTQSLSSTKPVTCVPVPLFAEDIHDIGGLMTMNHYLFENSPDA
jgi:anion-transporting  ArsA/GET3 family ATPase